MQEYSLETLVAKILQLRKQLAFLPIESFSSFEEGEGIRQEISAVEAEIERLYEAGW